MMNRPLYPVNWPALARACKERAGWICEHCGVAQFTIQQSKRGNPYIVYLAAAHSLTSSKGDPEPELLCLCPSCHGKLDYKRKVRNHRIRLECLKHLRLLVEQGLITIREE